VHTLDPLLSLRLSVSYPAKAGAIRDVRLEVQPGEIVGLVGQSGSGKSTLALAILRLLSHKGARAKGEILFRGRDLMQLSEGEMRHVRGRDISLVLQSPLASLNPALRIGTQLREAWKAHASSASGPEPDLARLLATVSLPVDASFLRRYPRELSVGQAQRVLIAMAVIHNPPLLIADEPTSALDVITQAEILELFAKLNRGHGTAILYISHDLLSIAALCHRVAILHEGEIVECGCAEAIFRDARHPYTRSLLAALPRNPHAELSRTPLSY
jgi:ABC-type dipeptide/oligopeptide/nickel transport system ATPase component